MPSPNGSTFSLSPYLYNWATGGRGNDAQNRATASFEAYGGLGQNATYVDALDSLKRGYYSGNYIGAAGYFADRVQQSWLGVDTMGIWGPAGRILGSNWDNVMNSPVETTSGTSLEELVYSEMGPNAVPGIADLPPAVRNMMKFELMQQRAKRLTEFYSNFAHIHHKMLGDINQNIGRIA